MELLQPSDEKLFTVTDVTPEEVFGITTLLSYSNLTKSTIIERWVRNFLLLRVSRLRLGRKEFLLLSSGIAEMSEAKKRGKKLADAFQGLK